MLSIKVNTTNIKMLKIAFYFIFGYQCMNQRNHLVSNLETTIYFSSGYRIYSICFHMHRSWWIVHSLTSTNNFWSTGVFLILLDMSIFSKNFLKCVLGRLKSQWSIVKPRLYEQKKKSVPKWQKSVSRHIWYILCML